MPVDAPQQTCPACGLEVNVSEAEPLANVTCPGCGAKMRVQRAFDNFALVETLGAGGMGSVYKARDTRLERFVALKLLRKELSAHPVEAARLEQEARVTAAVNHPNVVQVYSSGIAHGQIYLVMELVDHGSLDDLMAQHGKIPEAQVLDAGIQVAKGLQAAQQKGLIHRDVKPANILFSDAITAKIGDFGLAVAAGQQAEAQNEIWGTPYYVAPERLDNAPEDFRSDIYSLGATLFHAIAGRPPMEGESTSAAELRRLKSHPPDLHEIAPDVSRETFRIINKMLAPEPENRFTSYGHLIAQLENAARALPVASARRRRRWWQLAAAVSLLTLFLAAGVSFIKMRKTAGTAVAPTASMPSPAPDTAALQLRYAEARRQLIAEEYDAAATAFSRLLRETKNQQPLSHWVRLHGGLALLLQGKISPARDLFQQIERAGAFSHVKPDADLAAFFVDTARKLATAGPVRANTVAELDPKSVHAFALFLFGAKNWQLSEFGDTATLFERFVASEPPAAFGWIAEHKPLARKFLEDYRAYLEWKNVAPQRFADVAAIRAAIEKLRATDDKLQMAGPLSDSLQAEIKRLSADLAQREKAEKQARAQQQKEQFDRSKPELLARWRSQLIADLKTGNHSEQIKIGETTYQGIKSADETTITLRAGAYGVARLPWDRFSPDLLLAISRWFTRAGGAAVADRQWLAAVYAQSIGQMEIGRNLADEAAKSKPEYREELEVLFPP